MTVVRRAAGIARQPAVGHRAQPSNCARTDGVLIRKGVLMFRKLLILAAIIPACVLIVPASPAQARACQRFYHCITTYYSDPSHTTVVGRMTDDCRGESAFWGTRGNSLTFFEAPC